MNSPVDPALLHLVQQEVKFLQDHVNNLSVEFDQDKMEVQQELQNTAVILKEMKQMLERLKIFQGNLAWPLLTHFHDTHSIIATQKYFLVNGL